jgi:hypothetical protein
MLHRNISTTTIRKMVESEINDAVQQGTVSHLQQQQIHHVNGHSHRTMRRYYALEDRMNDGRYGLYYVFLYSVC